jgi:hypothetical protein
MDQDITHKVTPPSEAANGRPRYSLVWKLVLHSREGAHPGETWERATEPFKLGSAAQQHTGKAITPDGKSIKISEGGFAFTS